MSMLPVIAGLAFLCGGLMLFDDLMNEVFYLESAATVKKFKDRSGLSREAAEEYRQAQAIVNRRLEEKEQRIMRRTGTSTRLFLSALIAGNLTSATLILKTSPAIKRNPVFAELIDALHKKDRDAINRALVAFRDILGAPAPDGPGPS